MKMASMTVRKNDSWLGLVCWRLLADGVVDCEAGLATLVDGVAGCGMGWQIMIVCLQSQSVRAITSSGDT